jgi:tRNA (guanine37-N1)-methyltransferase
VTSVRLDVVTIFPDYLAPLDLSLIGKARRDGILDVHVHDLRDFAHDRHRTVDDSPFGGGAGMVMKPQPWAEALDHVLAAGRAEGAGATDAPGEKVPHLVVPGPAGVPFTQGLARALAQEPWLAFACGRYEGIDERVYEHAAERMPVTVVSLGDYVLNGGEVAVLAMVEAIGRLLPGVVGNAESLVEESHEGGLLEYPVYTRPARWQDGDVAREVPPVLLSGDHGAVAAWRHEQRLARTAARRPDLLSAAATTGALAELDVRVATPADAPELLVLQRACWMPEARVSGGWGIPPLDESLEEVAEGIGAWTTYAVRTASAHAGAGRLVASVRGRVRPGDDAVWETGRLMVAPDLQGRGLGRELLELAEATAPASVTTFWINTGAVSEGNQRRYRRAGYRLLPGEGTWPGTVDLVKPRRPR